MYYMYILYFVLICSVPLILAGGLPDPCSPDPCLNGGTCTAGASSSYTCACASGYTGLTCNTVQMSEEDTGLSNGEIAGIVVGSIAGAALLAVGGIIMWKFLLKK
ncbi:hepatocyte growth factor activator-like [Mytilus trossulus]|uniref:hepatocyte growth factor activator-like n=1 Tax=Mytilus trossulus TaxID=6551 RepID=UPI003003A87F